MDQVNKRVVFMASLTAADVSVEAMKALQEIESKDDVKSKDACFSQNHVISGKNRIYRYQFKDYEPIFGCMSNEPALKAVLQEYGKIDMLVLLASEETIGEKIRQAINDTSCNLFDTEVTLESALNMIKYLKQIKEIDESSLSSSLEYYLKEAAHFCSYWNKGSGSAYSINRIKIIRAPFDSKEFTQNASDEMIEKRNALVASTTMSAVRAALGDAKNFQKNTAIFIDTNGGVRDVAITLVAAVRMMDIYMEEPASAIIPEFVRGCDSVDKPFVVTNNKSMYYIFDLVSGLDEFVAYGRTKKLGKYFKDDELFKKIETMGDAFLICNPDQMLRTVKAVVDELRKYPEDSDSTQMKGYVVREIKKDFAGLMKGNPGDGLEDYLLPLIEWCIKKDLIQQALTLYAEKMPDFFVEKKVIYYNKESTETDSIAEIIRGMSKSKNNNQNDYSLDYRFIMRYFLIFPEKKKTKCYYNLIKCNYKCSKNQLNSFFTTLIRIGLGEQTNGRENEGSLTLSQCLYSNWKNETSMIGNILTRYYELKHKRNHMNHAKSTEITKEELRQDIKDGLQEIRSLIGER